MNRTEYVNCYCFNSACAGSIFNTKTFACIELPLSQALTQDARCPLCNSELVSKPVLEVKTELYRSLRSAEPVEEGMLAH